MSHKKAFDAQEAKELLGIAKGKMETYKDMATFLSGKRYGQDDLQAYFATVFPNQNPKLRGVGFDPTSTEDFKKFASKNAKSAMDIVRTQPGAQFAEGSYWQAFNAVTYMTDHVLGRENDTRLASSWFGVNKTKKVNALETALKFAEAS